MESSALEWLVNIVVENEMKGSWNDKTALHCAAGEDKVEVVRLLIEAGADVDAKDEDDKTPLHIAAENDSAKVVQLLINAGADLEAENDDNKTALQIAKDKGFSEIVKIIENGTSSNRNEDILNYGNLIISKEKSGIKFMIIGTDNVQIIIVYGKDKTARGEIKKFFNESTSDEDRKAMINEFFDNSASFKHKEIFNFNKFNKESEESLKRTKEKMENIKKILESRRKKD